MSPKVKEKRAALRAEIKKHNGRLADKRDAGKVRLELVHPMFVIEVAQVLQHGAQKYGDWNWTKGLPWTRIYASTLRHLYLWFCGEEKDKESGFSHLAHAATNVMFLMTWSRTHRELDDRRGV